MDACLFLSVQEFASVCILSTLQSTLTLWSLRGLSLPMYVVFKRCLPLFTLSIGVCVLRNGVPSVGVVTAVLITTGGAALAGEHKHTHTWVLISDKLVHWSSLRCSGFCTAHSPVYVFVTNVLTGFSPSPRIFHIPLMCWHTLPHQSCLSHCPSLHQNAFLLSPPYTLTWLPWTAALIQVWFCQRSLPC